MIEDNREIFRRIVISDTLLEAHKTIHGNDISLNALLFCTKGWLSLTINSSRFIVRAGELLVVISDTYVINDECSKDFSGILYAVNTDYLSKLDIVQNAYIYISLSQSPILKLEKSELNILTTLCDQVFIISHQEDCVYKEEIITSMIQAIYYQIYSFYMKYNDSMKIEISFKRQLFNRYMHLLCQNYHKDRRVAYYAEQLCISPKYLSVISKEFSDKTALEWIIETVITNSKSMLLTTNMTVQQIADRLNFPNASFFSQYFKKYVGQTPLEFRNNRIRRCDNSN